jgi:hypothetical protein
VYGEMMCIILEREIRLVIGCEVYSVECYEERMIQVE